MLMTPSVPGAGSGSRPDTRRWRVALVLVWVYTVIVDAAMVAGWGTPQTTAFLTSWHAIVSQFAAFGFLIRLLVDAPSGPRKTAWRLVFAAALSDVIASFWWIFLHAGSRTEFPGWFDAPFLVYYPIAAAGFAMFFLDQGGSFRKPQVWVDMLTLALGLGAALWLFVLKPQLAAPGPEGVELLPLIGYPLGDAVLMVLMSLLIMQISDWRREISLLLLIAAAALAFTTDLDWSGFNPHQRQLLQIWSNVGGYSLYYALLSTAAYLERGRRPQPAKRALNEASAYSFLPILSILIATAMLLGQKVRLDGVEGAALVCFALAGAIVVAARQQGVRQEIHRLHKTLAVRAGETHLTEIIRCAADLIVVVDAGGALKFASPASEAVLGLAPAELHARPAASLLGPEHEARLKMLLQTVASGETERAEIEVMAITAGERRSLLVVASDELANPSIAGISLTISDVTEQRRLEREVLEIAMRERERLSGEIDSGLGNALLEIQHSLEALRDGGTPGGHGAGEEAIAAIIGKVNGTIDTARRLALTLSPLHEVRGSLDLALARLARDVARNHSLEVAFERHCDVQSIQPGDAEHLYRIAREMLEHSVKHRGCSSVDIDLKMHDGQLLLSISDDGAASVRSAAAGIGADVGLDRDMGVRLASYRARLMGGTIRIKRSDKGWTRVEVAVPLR